MKRFLLYMISGMLPMLAWGESSVIVEAKLDSMMMWIGQQTGMHIKVTCDPDQNIEFPQYGDTVVTGLEIIPPVLTDTVYLNDGKRISVTRHYTVTCFDSALIYIPPIPVMVDGREYNSNRLALAFMTYDIPQGEENNIFGPKDNMRTPVQFREIWLPLLLYILSMFAIAGAIFLFKRYKDDKPIIRHIKVEARIPAHKRALDGMEEIRTSGLTSGEDSKVYYTRLTDLLREYINERFGFNATEMTSDEILENLRESRDEESLKNLASLLSTSDLVKFAKLKPLISENDRNLIEAIEFVKQTMVEVPEEELMPKEETVVVEKRSKGARNALLIITLTVTLAAAVLLGIALYKLYFVFF